jgi:hypothetical protein
MGFCHSADDSFKGVEPEREKIILELLTIKPLNMDQCTLDYRTKTTELLLIVHLHWCFW